MATIRTPYPTIPSFSSGRYELAYQQNDQTDYQEAVSKHPTKAALYGDKDLHMVGNFEIHQHRLREAVVFGEDEEGQDQEEIKEQEPDYLELEEPDQVQPNRSKTARREAAYNDPYRTPQKNKSSSRRTRTSPDRNEYEDNPTNLSQEQLRVQRMVYEAITRNNEVRSAEKLDVFSLGTEEGRTLTPKAQTEEGLPQRMIDSIITNRFDKSLLKTDDPSKLECSICCTDFKDGEEIKILQCLHTHHKACIDEWFTVKSICPDCKFNLRTLNIHQLV